MLTPTEQRDLLRTFCDQMRDALLKHADRWPEDWDGHELRELAAYAFDHERTRLMRENRRRRARVQVEIASRNLY